MKDILAVIGGLVLVLWLAGSTIHGIQFYLYFGPYKNFKQALLKQVQAIESKESSSDRQ